LVRIFFSMARGLEDQIKLLDNPKERQVLSAGFDAFLDEVRSQAKEISFLNWVAESYIGLGDGLAGDGSANGPAAQYYRKAVETYDQILATAKTQDLSAEAVQQLTVRKANALRHVGEYEQAIKIYTQVLLKEERRLDIQVEAARTYQAWAEAKGQSKRYANATLGGQIRKSTRKPVIWGWKKIASVTSRLLDQYSDTFFDAQYNAAYCYYKRAMREKNAARTKTLLGYAKRDITLTKKLYPDMGGPKWRDRFNRLMKDVQRALKEKPVGLAAVK
jgi:tetratricopeptide (TPR) repeat protein